MDAHIETWEYALLAHAYEAINVPAPESLPATGNIEQSEAYAYCGRLTRPIATPSTWRPRYCQTQSGRRFARSTPLVALQTI